jgi:arylsulfatase A-like enzyme
VGEERPNIVLIMLDQMRYDCAGYAGHPMVQTPILDRMASEGVCFETAYTSSPVCSPARGSWLTGLYPHTHRLLDNYNPGRRNVAGYHLPEEITALGDVCYEAGYRCGVVGPWHMGDDETPQRGFYEMWKTMRYQEAETDAYAQHLQRNGLTGIYKSESSRRFMPHMNFGVTQLPRDSQRTSWAVNEGVDFIRTTDDPFLLFLSIKDPHPHVYPPADMVDLYRPEAVPDPPDWDCTFEGKPAAYREDGRYFADKVDIETIRCLISTYYGMISHIDDQLGKVFRALEETGVDDNTIVAFISDHGEMLGEHGLFTKANMYEGSVRVPCLLRWPCKLPPGLKVKAPFAGVDLMPTLLDLAGLPIPTPMHGCSVAGSILEGAEPEGMDVLSEISLKVAVEGRAEESLAATIMIRSGGWKLVRHRFFDDELYDLDPDPGELTNLAGDPGHAETYVHLRQRIAEMLTEQGAGPYAWAAECP